MTMRAFVLFHEDCGLQLSFGEDAVEAAVMLQAKTGVNYEAMSVAGSFELSQPIDLGAFWMYFTNSPPRWRK